MSDDIFFWTEPGQVPPPRLRPAVKPGLIGAGATPDLGDEREIAILTAGHPDEFLQRFREVWNMPYVVLPP